MGRNDTLIFIPTYNERENVGRIVPEIRALGLDVDLLFVDDGSPDGTGELLDEMKASSGSMNVVHRSGKQGIGNAHLEGIRWAYEKGYETLVTMDCDFSHSPSDIPRMLAGDADVVIASRYLRRNSLKGWSPLRRFLTWLGHQLTERLLGMRYDATGAFRVYRLRRVPEPLFDLVSSQGYSFFFESLHLLHVNGFSIEEVPIVLPARTYGHSKMSLIEASRSAKRVFSLFARRFVRPQDFLVPSRAIARNPSLPDESEWDGYWDEKQRGATRFYDLVAALYRNLVIRRRLNAALRKQFRTGAALLHAGCGSGQVDGDIQGEFEITAVDVSMSALSIYSKLNRRADVLHASIFDLSLSPGKFDGIYNLGVVEHFDEQQIGSMLASFHGALKPEGKIVMFWPHVRGTSVLVLRLVHWLLNDILRKNVHLHPPEVTHVRSRGHAARLLGKAGFRLIDYSFGPMDGFVQAVVVGQRGARGSDSP